MVVFRRFTKKINGLPFFLHCFSFFVYVPEPGKAHSTECTTPPLRTPAWERCRPDNSPRLAKRGGRGVWHVCVDDTLLLLLCN